MKEVLNIGLGDRSFLINGDAYDRLSAYLDAFRRRTGMGYQAREVMDDLEMRIAEIFTESLSSTKEVVDIFLVERVIAQLGMPDGSDAPDGAGYATCTRQARKLYRDTGHGVIGGVAAGLAYYFNIDILLVRIIFVCLLLCGSFGFWLYVILWIAVPSARTGADRCRMHGVPLTPENIRRFQNEI